MIEIIGLIAVLLVFGAISGIIAGLLGIGGGSVLVPLIYYTLKFHGFEQDAMHIAAGTSLLIIVFTGFFSARTHYKNKAADINIFMNFIPGVVIGVLLGKLMIESCTDNVLKFLFAVMQIIFALYMLVSIKEISVFSKLPKQPWFSIVSTFNTCISVLMGVGGGIPNIIYMTACNIGIHRAIATASLINPIIGLAGAISFLSVDSSAISNLPPFTIGYVNFLVFALLVVPSSYFAPIGARLAHKLPVKKLKKIFIAFLMIVSLKMLIEVLF